MGEVQSLTKLYVDFGAGPGGAGGNILLVRIKSVKVKDDSKTEVVKAVGVQGGAGFRDTEGGGTITLEAYREDKQQINWRALKRDKRKFTFTMQEDSGAVAGTSTGVRENFYTCRVSNVDRDADEEGNAMDNIEIKYLRSVQAP